MNSFKEPGKDTRAKITFKHVKKRRKGKFFLIGLCCLLIVFSSVCATVAIMMKHVTNVKLFFNEGDNFKNSKSMIKVREVVGEVSKSMVSVIAVSSENGVNKEQNVCSGIAIDDGTYVLTSYSAISEANKIKIKTYDSSVYEGSVTGFDSAYDIALVKISDGEIQPADIPSASPQMKNGEIVVSVGNPDGAIFSSNFQIGQITNTSQNIIIKSNGTKLMQNLRMIKTDIVPKSINNCSALYDMDGNLLGVNNMSVCYDDDDKRQSLYISADDLASITSSMRDNQDSLIKYIGIYGESAVSQRKDGIEGVYAKDVTLKGAGYEIGIRPTDIITAVNGISVDEVSDINKILGELPSGETVSFTIYKNNEYVDYDLCLNKSDE